MKHIYHDDTYQWGNDLCSYHTFSKEDISTCLSSKGIHRVVFVGDSITRNMFDDLHDLFNDINPAWLHDHLDKLEATGAGDDIYHVLQGKVGGWNTSNQQFSRENITVNLCRPFNIQNETCRTLLQGQLTDFTFQGFFHMSKWFPNFGFSEFKDHFRKILIPETPDIIVFNTGLWTIDSRYISNSKYASIIDAIVKVADELDAILVWRGTTYVHGGTHWLPTIRLLNEMAKERVLQYRKGFVFNSAYDITRGRPDRSLDTIHYRYEYKGPKQVLCSTIKDVYTTAPCVLMPPAPQPASKTMLNTLFNYLCNTPMINKQKLRN
jgi:hypothetical protein